MFQLGLNFTSKHQRVGNYILGVRLVCTLAASKKNK